MPLLGELREAEPDHGDSWWLLLECPRLGLEEDVLVALAVVVMVMVMVVAVVVVVVGWVTLVLEPLVLVVGASVTVVDGTAVVVMVVVVVVTAAVVMAEVGGVAWQVVDGGSEGVAIVVVWRALLSSLFLAGGVEAEERERRGVGGVNIPPPSDPRPLMPALKLLKLV